MHPIVLSLSIIQSSLFQTCAGEQINIQTCSSINSQRPYCDLTSNACVASIDNSQSCVPQDYKCTGHGQFPDPSNCRRYYICDAPNTAPLGVYECPLNYVYNSKTGLCVRSICQNIDCSKTPNQYIISSADPSILIYCFSGNNVQKPYVFRCPDPQNMQYDKDSLKCVYKCTREGRFADRVKCTGFYDCFWSIYGYQYNHNTCPSGYAFNVSSLQCVQATTCKNEVDGQEVSTTSTPSPQ